MKKLVFFVVFAAVSLSMMAQCTIDQNNTEFLSPRPDSLPCVERGVFYEQVFQFAIPASVDLSEFIPNLPFPYTLIIDEVVIDSVSGLPEGFTYSSNPADGVMQGGEKGCALLSGSTNEPAGDYPLSFAGYITIRGFPIPGVFDGDTTFDFSAMQNMGGGGFGPGRPTLKVIEQGGSCNETSGIKNFNAELQSALQVYPNPSNGLLNISVSSFQLKNVEVSVLDFTGKQVFSESVIVNSRLNKQLNFSDFPKGIYAVLVKTDKGVAIKNVALE